MTVRLDDVLASFDDQWAPRLVAGVNDHDVKVAKVQGEFVWHSHPDSDELFLVIDGELTIELRDGAVVTMGPSASEARRLGEAQQRRSRWGGEAARHTGDAGGDRTAVPVDLT